MTRMIFTVLAALWFAFFPHLVLTLAVALVAGLICGLAACVYLSVRQSGMAVSAQWRLA